MARNLFKNIETENITIRDSLTLQGNLNSSTATLNHINVASMHASQIVATSVNFAKGQLRRAYTQPLTKDDVATAGTLVETFFTFPQKVKIIGFGIQSAASDVVLATNDGFELRTHNGTKLATWVADGDYTLATGHASVAPIETATYVATNVSLIACVGTNVGVSGSVFYIVDYRPVGA